MILVCFTLQGNSQTVDTDFFKSRLSGNWESELTWESSHDSIVWIPATKCPSQYSRAIVILSGHTITVNKPDQKASQLEINSGSELILNYVLSVGDGVGDDLICYGKITANESLYLSSTVIARIYGEYIVNLDKTQNVPKCVWEEGSDIRFVAITNKPPSESSMAQSFYNFDWNSPAQGVDVTLTLPETMEVRGNTTITSNDKKVVIIAATTPRTYQFIGDVELKSNGRLLLSALAAPITLNIGGNLTINSLARLYLGTAIANNHNTINLSGNLTLMSANSYINRNNTGENYGNGTLSFVNTSVVHEVTTIGTIFNVNYVLNPGVKVNFNKLTIDAGHTLMIDDNASIITNSSVVATVNRNLPDADWSVPLDGWHLLSSPVKNQSVAAGGFTYQPDSPDYPKYDFYSWDEPGNLWLNQKKPENSITSFESGKGYFVAYDDADVKTFNGTLNLTDVSAVNLSVTGNSVFSGFHLLGNPFQSSLDWNNIGWNRNNISEVAYVWNEVAMNYLPVTTINGMIPPNQGFFIQATDPLNSIIIPASARAHSDNSFNRNVADNALFLKVCGHEVSAFDETIIRTADDASSSFDLNDGHKMEGSEIAPRLYTNIADDEPLAVNTFQTNALPTVIPLHFKRGQDSTYKLTVLLNTIDSAIWLEDIKKRTIIQVTDSMEYNFKSALTDNENRFLLHFGTLGVDEVKEQPFEVYSFDKTIYIKDLNSVEFRGTIKIISITGETIYECVSGRDHLTIIPLPDLSKGIYLVHLYDNTFQMTRKVVIM